VIRETGVLGREGRVDLPRTALEGLGKTLAATDEVVIEATGTCMAASRLLPPLVPRAVIADPLQVKAIAHAHVKTDEVDAGTLANLYAAGYRPEKWTPAAATERLRRLVARRCQVVRQRTRPRNAGHSILAAPLAPKCPHADLFASRGRAWLASQLLPDDDRAAVERRGRARPLLEAAEAGELLRPRPAGPPVGTGRRTPWAHQQGRTQPCPSHAWSRLHG
jgi:transposase